MDCGKKSRSTQPRFVRKEKTTLATFYVDGPKYISLGRPLITHWIKWACKPEIVLFGGPCYLVPREKFQLPTHRSKRLRKGDCPRVRVSSSQIKAPPRALPPRPGLQTPSSDLDLIRPAPPSSLSPRKCCAHSTGRRLAATARASSATRVAPPVALCWVACRQRRRSSGGEPPASGMASARPRGRSRSSRSVSFVPPLQSSSDRSISCSTSFVTR